MHVPLDVVSEAFGLDPDHFESRFGFPKPHPDKQIVTYCVKGMRGAKAAAAIRAVGHAKVEVYGGSLQDWKEQGGPLERYESTYLQVHHDWMYVHDWQNYSDAKTLILLLNINLSFEMTERPVSYGYRAGGLSSLIHSSSIFLLNKVACWKGHVG